MSSHLYDKDKEIIMLKARIESLETLLPVVKQSIEAITPSEANDAMTNLIRVLNKIEPSYFISINEWLANPTFDVSESN